jgi:hypothetical protein
MRRLGHLLRKWADRIDRDHAFLATHWHLTFETGKGADIHEQSYGCRLWYYAPDYGKAHSEAKARDPELDEETMRLISEQEQNRRLAEANARDAYWKRTNPPSEGR